MIIRDLIEKNQKDAKNIHVQVCERTPGRSYDFEFHRLYTGTLINIPEELQNKVLVEKISESMKALEQGRTEYILVV